MLGRMRYLNRRLRQAGRAMALPAGFDVTDGLIAAWLEAPGTSLTADSSGNGHTLTNSGVTAADGWGVFDGASHLECVGDAIPADETGLTVAFEFQFDTAAAHPLVNKTGWTAAVASDKGGRKANWTIGIRTAASATLLSTATTYQLVGTFVPTAMGFAGWHLWLDGDEEDSESDSTFDVSQSGTLQIGTDGLGAFLTGKIRKVRVWGVKQPDSVIPSLFDALP